VPFETPKSGTSLLSWLLQARSDRSSSRQVLAQVRPPKIGAVQERLLHLAPRMAPRWHELTFSRGLLPYQVDNSRVDYGGQRS
jgi:hypothetical protein